LIDFPRFHKPKSDSLPYFPLLLWILTVGGIHTFFCIRYFGASGRDIVDIVYPWNARMMVEWLHQLGRFGLTLLFFFGAWAVGRVTLEKRSELHRDFFVSSAVGLVVMSFVAYFLAVAHLSRPVILRAVFMMTVVLGVGEVAPLWRRISLKGFICRREWAFTERGLLNVLLACGVLLFFLTSIVPETFYDALVYHLAVPQAYLQAGRMVDMAGVHLSRLPGLAQMTYLWGLVLGDDRMCKLINVGCGLLWAGALSSWVQRIWGGLSGRWAALLLLSTPMIGVSIWSCNNDVLCGYFCFVSMTIWMDFWNKGPSENKNLNMLLSGLLLGAATATKYTAIFASPFFAWHFLMKCQDEKKFLWRDGLYFAVGFLIPLAPWWIRTGFWTGNPFFPKATGLFKGDIAEALALMGPWDADVRGHLNFPMRAMSILREGLWGVYEGRFGFIGPMFLCLMPMMLFLRRSYHLDSLALYASFSYLFFVWQSGRLRYFLPHLAVLYALSAAALKNFDDHPDASPWAHSARAITRSIAAFLVVLNLFWLVMVFHRFNQGWDVVWGRQTASEYLRREHIGVYGHPSQGAFDFLRNRGVRSQDKVFIIGEARSYRCPGQAIVSSAFNMPIYARWLQTMTPPLFLDQMKKEGVTHLVINLPEMKRIVPEPYKTDVYLRPLGTVIDTLGAPVYRDRWTIVFEMPKII